MGHICFWSFTFLLQFTLLITICNTTDATLVKLLDMSMAVLNLRALGGGDYVQQHADMILST
jgi:hypothetical protein